MFRYIVFDFDGTLADSKAIFLSIYNRLAQKYGYGLMTPENLEYLRGLSISERCSYLGVPMYRIPFLAIKLIKEYKASLPQLQFSPDVNEMLERLTANGVPYAVLSTNSQKNIQEFFALQGLPVPEVFSSSRLFGKDRLLRKLLKVKKFSPADILYVGDEARDIIACRACGIRVAWVSWGYDTEIAIQNHPPDYIFHHPEELGKLTVRI